MKTEQMALLTDLYELTMAAVYFREEMFAPATFSLFIRDYPPYRGYFLNAGLEEALAYLESFQFQQDDLDYLDTTGLFSSDFLHYLSALRFSGQVCALPEGRLFFKDEPVLEITAPLIEAQIIESFLINTVNIQVLLATKASRCVCAANSRKTIDFSLRRTQGPEAGLRMARSAYLAGMDGTSNVLAGKKYGLPVSGTMAHSFVTGFPEELEAFRAFARAFPENTVLLIDTYDTLAGAQKALQIAGEMEEQGRHLRGVRLDSGDMLTLSRQVREMFDAAGFNSVKIFASGGFDEWKIREMDRQKAPIDAFGVGTKAGVSADAPYMDIAYKLVKYAGQPLLKLSSGKKPLVAEKQVFREKDRGRPVGDTIGLRRENHPGEALLRPRMQSGRRIFPPEDLTDIRERSRQELDALDERYKRLENPARYPVKVSPKLEALQAKVVHQVREKELGES